MKEQEVPEAPGEVWLLNEHACSEFVLALVVRGEGACSTQVVTLDCDGYPEARVGRTSMWPVARCNGWRRVA